MNDAFEARLAQVQAQIEQAAHRAGRRTADITLVAVTKTHPAAAVLAAYAGGLRDFGENRVEALQERLLLELPEAHWHIIGQIQSRKVRDVAGRVALIHSVDRLGVAEELSKRMTVANDRETGNEKREMGNGKRETEPHPQKVLLQVNVSGEASKGGWRVTNAAEMDGFVAEVARVVALPGVLVRGLMTLAPYTETPETVRPFFAKVRIVQETLQTTFPHHTFAWLSMGMTNDYPIAIEEGATHVRIGTALFGERE